MTFHTYRLVTATIFLLMAAVHLARAVLGWGLVVDDITIPVWASWVAVVVMSALSWAGFSSTRAGGFDPR